MMRPWGVHRWEIRRIHYDVVLALSANFILSARDIKYGDVVKAFALISGVLRRALTR